MSKESKHSSLVTGMTEREEVVDFFRGFCEAWREVEQHSNQTDLTLAHFLEAERDACLAKVAGDTDAELAIHDACRGLILPKDLEKK